MTLLTQRDFALRGATAVLPDRVIAEATIVVRDGVIESVERGGAAPKGAVDVDGAYCAPGLVDTHSDGLEKERSPRPGVELPLDFAVRSFEGRAWAAGVTTMFHGVGFANHDRYGRSVELADAMCAEIDGLAHSGNALIDHFVLHRLDARDLDGLAAVDRIVTSWRDADLPLVSYEDHTPGQGQYTDRTWLERYVAGTRGMTDEEAKRYIDDEAARRDEQLAHRDDIVRWCGDRAVEGTIRLMCHDPVNAEEIDAAADHGVTIAEFPTTVEAAGEAHSRGMSSVCGGPNALRGESHSGNVSARELIALGLCDVVASDYLPSTLMGAVGAMVQDQVCDLPTAIGLVTSGPAAAVGLHDRGRLEPGHRADLIVFDLDGRLPTIRAVVSQGSSRSADHEPRPTDSKGPSHEPDEQAGPRRRRRRRMAA